MSGDQVVDTALLVLVGDWDCCGDGCWDFRIEKCMAQCVMVSKEMSYEDLKKEIEMAFYAEIKGVIRRLSYLPPSEMSMFSSGKTPPVSIHNDASLKTFFKVRAATKPVNLLVTFDSTWERETIPSIVKAQGGELEMIHLADGTPSLNSIEVVESSVNGAEICFTNEGNKGCELVTDGEEIGALSSGIDLNNIFDTEMMAELETVEEMAREAQGLRSSKGKEKVTDADHGRVTFIAPDTGEAYQSGDEDVSNHDLWDALVSKEYRALQLGSGLEHGETSNAVNPFAQAETANADTCVSVGDVQLENIGTRNMVVDVLHNQEHVKERVGLVGGRNGSDFEEDAQLDEAIQLSLSNIYTDIIESDVVPSYDCVPCVGDEVLATQDVQKGVYDPGNDAIFIGRVFRNKADMQTALAIYAIKRFFSYKQTRSDKERLIVRCLDMKCPWRVYGHTAGGTSDNMVVRTATLTHTCDVSTRSQYGKKATCKVIAEVLKSKYANGKIGPRAVDIPDIILNEFRVSISYMKAWHAKEKAVLAARGSPEDSYKLLIVYLHLLEKYNPGTVCEVVSTGVRTSICKFKYLFFAIGACIHAAKFMRRVLVIDATTIKAKFKGTLLTASFQDGNFQIMPLGFGVVDGENEPAWTWFFKQLVKIVLDTEELVFVSDRHSSIYAALRAVYPNARHGACAVHLYRNVKSRYSRQKGLAFLVSQAASAYTVGEFREKFEEIERRSPLCANYLRGIGISHWTRVYFQGKRYNIMSSNIAESLNAALAKALEFPIVSMVETIRMMLMRWFYCRHTKAKKHLSPVTPEVEDMLMKNLSDSAGLSVVPASVSVFQVNNNKGVTFIVDVERKACTCKRFETLGIPCCHALAAARVSRTPITGMVEEYYKGEGWTNAYSVAIMPVPNAEDETIAEEILNSDAQPPQTYAGPGRPRKRRIPSVGEESARKRRKNGPNRCGRCYGTGHNRATCKNPIP